MRVVVVGAGLGGLSAACHLAGRGHQVRVIERAARPGGRAGLVEEAGYRLDTGPAVLTMAGILSDTFAAAGADMADHVDLVALDPMYRACFAQAGDPVGAGVVRLRPGREAMTEEIRSVCGPREAASFGPFCDWLERLYRLEMPSFIDRNYDSWLDITRPLAPIWQLVRLGGLRRLQSVVAGYFQDARLQRLFSFQAMYAGLSPLQALALYGVITYMDTVQGVLFPRGGMHSVATGLAQAAEKAGARIQLGSGVERIVRRPGEGGAVTGVRLDGGEVVPADAVVCNLDLPVAYRQLLPELEAPRAARRGRYSPSCVVWLAGLDGGVPDGAAHHNLHFGESWEDSFAALLGRGARRGARRGLGAGPGAGRGRATGATLMPDPSILVSVPTVTDPALAPAGRHCLYVLEPVPNLDGALDWASQGERLRTDLSGRVEALGYLGDGGLQSVEVERFCDPVGWERQGMERGTPFALSHHFFQTGPFRPGNVDRRVPGLAFVGSGTQPGVGIPMVLLSGRLAAERVSQLC